MKRLWIAWDHQGMHLFVDVEPPDMQSGLYMGGTYHGKVSPSFAADLGIEIEQGQCKEVPVIRQH